jgi:hypothetical protein
MVTFEIIQTENFDENESKIKGDIDPCIRCGKGVKNKKYAVELVDGGLTALSKNEEADWSDAGYMGMHFIGSECRKHIPSEFIHKY